MLDNLFGRPSNNLRRIEVYSILALSVFVLNKPRKHWFLSLINRYCVRVAPWRIILATLSASYLIKHMFLLLFLSEPQPLNRMYTRNFFRATWIVTALDAGFFSAMNVRPDALRHFLSVVLSVYYLFNADSASEKVRKYRAGMYVFLKFYHTSRHHSNDEDILGENAKSNIQGGNHA